MNCNQEVNTKSVWMSTINTYEEAQYYPFLLQKHIKVLQHH